MAVIKGRVRGHRNGDGRRNGADRAKAAKFVGRLKRQDQPNEEGNQGKYRPKRGRPCFMACDTARWRRKGFPLNGATKV